MAARIDAGARPISGDRAAPPKGRRRIDRARPATSAATTTSGSIRARRSRSSTARRRTSLIVDPPDGRVPALTPAARQRIAARLLAADVRHAARATIRGSKPRRAPTTIPSAVRSASAVCSGSARPPGRRRCRTTSTTTCTRSCRRRARHDPHRDGPRCPRRPHERAASAEDHPQVDGRLGRPLGRRHAGGGHHQFHRPDPPFSGCEPERSARRSRRFTRRRRCRNALLYRFTVEDPATWDRPWTGEYTWPATDELIYEYACHEANYALENILRGARRREADAAATKAR